MSGLLRMPCRAGCAREAELPGGMCRRCQEEIDALDSFWDFSLNRRIAPRVPWWRRIEWSKAPNWAIVVGGWAFCGLVSGLFWAAILQWMGEWK